MDKKIRLTKRGHQVVGVIAIFGFLVFWGFAGWLENLGM